MISFEDQGSSFNREASTLLELAEKALAARSFEELAEFTLPCIAGLAGSRSALLYLNDPRVPQPLFFQFGFEAATALKMQDFCARIHHGLSTAKTSEAGKRCALDGFKSSDVATQPIVLPTAPDQDNLTGSVLYTLGIEKACYALLGITLAGEASMQPAALNGRVLNLLASAIERLLERVKLQRQLVQLNTYQVVSSLLTQTIDLHELLETILNCCIAVASAEEASILLLDREEKNFCFYQTEGASKPLLLGLTFPADKGIAGAVLKTQAPEIVVDAQRDTRFYAEIDSASGFRTNNMIAVPLTEGKQKIGVLEVLNKEGGGSFIMEDLNLLVSIAEEIAYGIRNSVMFEYVVNIYCMRRKGYNTCAGCKRPLGDWTPCVKYREATLGF